MPVTSSRPADSADSAEHAPPAAPAAQRVVLVRHGHTAWSAAGRHTGRTDIALTDAGVEQARRIPSVLRPLGLTDPLVLSSPRTRALDTAALAGLSVDRIEPRLAEWDYGDYEGITTARIRRTVPCWTVWTHPCPRGESASEVGRRADDVIADVAAESRATGRDAILVGHGHFSRVLMARWIEEDVTLGARLAMPTAGVAELGHEHEYRVINSIAAPHE